MDCNLECGKFENVCEEECDGCFWFAGGTCLYDLLEE